MNTAFLDAQNLAWKIHVVEQGFADRSLLESYESERKAVAETLISFDNRYAKLFSQRPPAVSEIQAASEGAPSVEEDNEFIKTYKESREFASGYGVSYGPNSLNWSGQHPAQSAVISPAGNKLPTGRLLANADVTRLTDANPVKLEQEIPLNGSFRIYVFAGRPELTARALADFAAGLDRSGSFFSSYLRPDADAVSPHEQHNPHSIFFTFCVVFAGQRASIEISRDVPAPLARYRDHVYADDIWDRGVPGAKAAAHAKMGLDEDRGAVVVVRPDGYVGIVASLVEGSATVDALNQYFGAFCTKKLGGA